MNDNLLAVDDKSAEPPKSYFKELVGENAKFKTEEDLARGKYESDQYIKVLEAKQDELRADYLKLREEHVAGRKLEELIGQLDARQQQLTNLKSPLETEVINKPAAFDPKEIESLVSSKVQEIETSKKQTDNFNKVRETLKEHYGDNFQDVIKTQLKTLDLTEEELNDLARKRPAFLLKALGVDETKRQDNFQAPMRSNQRSDSFAPKGSAKRTWSFYQQMKKDDPKAYYNPKTNVAMHNDMIALGDSFKDGDFHKYGD